MSLNASPICEGLFPSFASFTISISASAGLYLVHEGGFFLNGFVEPAFPFFLEYFLAILSNNIMETKTKVEVTTLSKGEKISFRDPYVETYTGKRIYFDNITINDISIIDIAHSLSQLCRFTGHTKEFYSVAQHSVLVSDAQTTLAEKRAGLLHDATETYLNDLASPLKAFIKGCGYSDLEEEFHVVINNKFNVNDGMTPNNARRHNNSVGLGDSRRGCGCPGLYSCRGKPGDA